MTTKTYILICTLCLVLGLALGRFSLPAKTTDLEQSRTVTDTTVKDNTTKEITQTKKPDGTVTTVTVIKNDIDTNIQAKTKETDQKTTVFNTDTLGINLMASVDVSNPTRVSYGAQVEKRILGPLNAGIWGLSDGHVGISLGLRF